MTPSNAQKFRYDINALRAISVIGVLLFHYKVTWIKGGFAGVDVFFVISGYLMSKIIINGLNRGNFSLTEFYSRRLNRIMPALLALVLTLTVVGFFTYFPVNYQLNERNAAASILFISNIVYWQSAGYFAEASDSNILLHTWSLSVEWQFYLIYPVILLVVHRFKKSKAAYLLGFITAISLTYVAAIWYTGVDKDGAFYLLHSRAWEMMFGGLAFLSEDWISNFKPWLRRLLAITGYVTIFASFYFLNTIMDWPGGYTLIPVFAAFLIIAVNCNNFKVLKFSAVQGIGKISYSLYLWHWPVYVIAQYLGFPLSSITIVVLILIAFLLGYVSYQYVESISFITNKPVLTGALSMVLVTGALSYFDINKIAFNYDALMVANYMKVHPEATIIDKRGCFLTTKHKAFKEYNQTACLTINPEAKNFLLIGDSHATDLSEPLRARVKNRNINILVATASGCSPFVNPKSGRKLCKELVNYTFNVFIEHNANKIDGVIISANWVNRGSASKVKRDLEATLVYLKKYNIPAIIIGQNENFSVTYPVLKAKELQFNKKLSDIYVNRNCYKINDFMKSNFKTRYVEIINKKSSPALAPNYCPYMFDKDHFTPYGADLAVSKILANPIAKQFFN